MRPLPSCYVLYEQPFYDLLYLQLKEIFRSPSFSFGNFCYVLSQENDCHYHTTNLRFTVQEPMMDLSPSKDSKHLFPVQESKPCIYSVFAFDCDFPPSWDLSLIFDYAKEQNLTCADEAYAFYVYSVLGDGEQIYNYYEVYVPLLS